MRIQKEFEDLQKYIDKLSFQQEKKIVKNYAVVLKDLRSILSDVYSRYSNSNGILSYSEMSKYNRLKVFEREIISILSGITRDNAKIVKAGLKNVYKESFDITKDAIQSKINKTIRGVIKDDILELSLQNPISGLTLNKRLERNRAGIITTINEQITQGLVKGESYRQMSDRIKGRLEGDATKAVRIVRTESHRVMEDGKYDSLNYASNQGVDMEKTWLTAGDEAVRSKHKSMNDKSVKFDQDFILPDGARGQRPGSIGVAEHDINCRCIFIIDIK